MCAKLTMRKGEKEDNVGILLPKNKMMKDCGEGEYKYLGVLEVGNIKTEKMNCAVTKEYKRKLTLLLKSKMGGGSMIKAINTWAVAVIRYLS